MNDTRICLDCFVVGPMDQHGRCGTCGSDAVALAEHLQEFFAQTDKSVAECERIYETEELGKWMQEQK